MAAASCKQCDRNVNACFAHCHEAEDGKHIPDFSSISLSDSRDAITADRVIFDVWCKTCGTSGTIVFDPSKEGVTWE